NTNATQGSVGPKRSPLGLAADPGGVPLYKNGALVGGVGVVSNGVYGIDLDVFDVDQDADELIAVAGSSGFSAPDEIRGALLAANGLPSPFVVSESLAPDPASAPAFGTLPGALVAVPGYVGAAAVAGVAFGTPASGYRPATTPGLAALGAFTLVEAGDDEGVPLAAGGGTGALTANDGAGVSQDGPEGGCGGCVGGGGGGGGGRGGRQRGPGGRPRRAGVRRGRRGEDGGRGRAFPTPQRARAPRPRPRRSELRSRVRGLRRRGRCA